MNKDIVIVDIDGTCANNEHRAHLLKDIVESDLHRTAEDMKNDKWSAFYELCDKDTPYLDMRSIIKRVGAYAQIVYLTGRVERIRGKTERWLRDNGFPAGRVIMRKDDDFRPNAEFKVATLAQNEITPDSVLCIFEDNDVETLRAAGFRTLQVANGGMR